MLTQRSVTINKETERLDRKAAEWVKTNLRDFQVGYRLEAYSHTKTSLCHEQRGTQNMLVRSLEPLKTYSLEETSVRA